MATHKLKILPDFFEATLSWDKLFETRKNDRDYKVGDDLELWEWDTDTGTYSGRHIFAGVSYILSDPQFVPVGYITMGIRINGRCLTLGNIPE